MSLINCPECGKEISDKAISCPNCGCPIQQQYVEYPEEEYEDEEKELGVSIASLVCYILVVIFNVLKSTLLGGILSIATIILVIISFIKKGKCICANIVFWINTVTFVIAIIIAVILNFVL